MAARTNTDARATFTKVAYPSMRKFGYKDSLAAGAIAGGGTLGILIPPSTIMVIYGIITETNIGKVFVAGILPGLVATALLCLAVVWITWRDPAAGPPGERSSTAQRLQAMRRVWPVILLFVLVIGGIYAGVFTATEGAGIGAGGAFVFALARRALTWRILLEILIESARTTSMLFMILIGAFIFANFINYTSMPADLKAFAVQFKATPWLDLVEQFPKAAALRARRRLCCCRPVHLQVTRQAVGEDVVLLGSFLRDQCFEGLPEEGLVALGSCPDEIK